MIKKKSLYYIYGSSIIIFSVFITFTTLAMTMTQTHFFKDDGLIPNSVLPLIIYKNAFPLKNSAGAAWLEKKFVENHWSNSWRNGVFAYHHYHSITHEALGVYSGSAILQLGGEKGKSLEVQAGDIIIIPAGVGHKCLKKSNDFAIVGAYPNGMDYDMNYGKKEERPKTDENIKKVPIPEFDPLYGFSGGLKSLWK